MPLWTLKKAFHLVGHRILLSKHSDYLNSSNSLPFFLFFFLLLLFSPCPYPKNRVQLVFIRGSYSSEETVKYGVPQGSVFGAVLFCIYINDLPLHIPSNSAECHMLADDTTLHTAGESVVQTNKKQNKKTLHFVLIVFQCGVTLITCSLIL